MRQVNNEYLFEELLFRTIEDLNFISEHYINELSKDQIEILKEDIIKLQNINNWEELKEIISKWEKFNKKLWDNVSTKIEEYNDKDNYRFIVHVVSDLINIPKDITLMKKTKKFFCCSLITENHQALYESMNYGFICDINGGFVGSYERDASTIVSKSKNDYSIHKIGDEYIDSYEPITLTRTPEHIITKNNEETLKYNGELLNYDDFNNYNEIIVDKRQFNITGMFYLSSVSSDELIKIKKIAKKNNLKLIKIKDNRVTSRQR